MPAAPPAPRPAVDPALVPERRGIMSFFSTVSRNGDWVLPRHFRVAALMGSVELDLTRARIGPGTSHIEIRSILGSVTIVAPHDVRVECEGEPIVGSFEVKRKAESTAAPDAPVVLITGTAIMSSVEVKVVDPNAPGLLERLRARLSPPRA